MPIIISHPAGPARLTHAAQADTRGVVRLTHAAQARTAIEVTVSHLAQASSVITASLAHLARASTAAQSVRLTHVAVTQASRPVRLEHLASATSGLAMPTVVRAGRPVGRLGVSSSNGAVISAQYTHSGTRESLNLTVYGVATPSALLDLSVGDSQGGSLYVQLDGDLLQYERRQTPTGTVTTLHAENRAASRLGSVRLTELIPWKLSPTSLPDRRVPCAGRPKPQEVGVTGIILGAFGAAGMSLSYSDDPFFGLKYREGERDYSTLGKTPDQVFADTLGQLGWVYVVRGTSAFALPPDDGPWSSSLGQEDFTGDLSVRGEAANTPSLLTVTGADLLVARPNLIELATAAPDMASLYREISPDYEWYVTTPTPDGETIKGFRKTAGQITYTNELTRSDVTVKETVDGAEQTETFSQVVTGYTSTQSRYDLTCRDAMTYQQTIKTSYGYGLHTNPHITAFSGPGWGGSYNAGDILADETQTVYQTFSPEGYLQSRATTTAKLVTLQQQGADGPLAGRGALQAREYVTQILSESYQPLGGGRWLRLWSLSGGQQLPLYDLASGDAVRLATRGGTFLNGQEILDQAPAQVSCPDPCGGQKIAYPQVVRRTLTDGREGQEATRALPFVDQASALDAYVGNIVASLAPSISTDATLSTVQDLRPGTKLAGSVSGIVQNYTLDAAAGLATVKITARQLMPTTSTPTSEAASGGPFRDMVLWRSPGGVVVNHFKDAASGVPTFDRIFVRATGANLPNPGDEVEWRRDLRFGPTATGNYGN